MNGTNVLVEKGYTSVCVICGKLLMVDREFCFDHIDMKHSWEFGQDEEQDNRAIMNIREPEEGVDYWVQKQVEIPINGSGRVICWQNVKGKLDYNGKDVEWSDIEEGHMSYTGQQRLLTFDNKPFSIEKWRQSKVNELAGKNIPTNVANQKQRYLTEFAH
jgi:hypothetical protein